MACTEPHDAEFAGVWRSNQRSYPEEDDDRTTVHEGCLDLVANYVDVSPLYAVGVLRISTIVRGMSREDWDNGNRGFRCFLRVNDNQVSRSLQGAGAGALESP